MWGNENKQMNNFQENGGENKGKKYNLVNKCCSLKGGKTKLSILTGINIILQGFYL